MGSGLSYGLWWGVEDVDTGAGVFGCVFYVIEIVVTSSCAFCGETPPPMPRGTDMSPPMDCFKPFLAFLFLASPLGGGGRAWYYLDVLDVYIVLKEKKIYRLILFGLFHFFH